jgi:hypothetical protein
MFFKFDPRTEKITVLAEDITRVCGEDPTVTPPHGKIHSPVVELDGWIYFGTHESYGSPTRKYAGAHLIGCELKTGKFRDFGILRQEYTNYAGVAADAKHKGVYVYLVYPGQSNDKPCLLCRVDLPGGEKRVVAELPPGGYDAAVYYLYADDDGNCWLPAPNGVLAKYDADAGKLVTFADALPVKNASRFRQWQWAEAIPGQNKALVYAPAGSTLYLFDPKAEGNRFRALANTGRAHLSLSLAGTTVYYITSRGDDLHLQSVDITAPKPEVVDYGRITDQDGRRPQRGRITSLAADAEGRVYMIGDWHTRPGDTATTRLQRDRAGNETYPAQGRCERFAYVKVTPPAKP